MKKYLFIILFVGVGFGQKFDIENQLKSFMDEYQSTAKYKLSEWCSSFYLYQSQQFQESISDLLILEGTKFYNIAKELNDIHKINLNISHNIHDFVDLMIKTNESIIFYDIEKKRRITYDEEE